MDLAEGAAREPSAPAVLTARSALVDGELRRSSRHASGLLGRMARYHMAWADAAGRPAAAPAGKLLRPTLCLWACEVAGGDPARALPAAAAIEWLHNFTLVHDDIQDGDLQRRHRPTVWTVFGSAQAINAGDGLFALGLVHLVGSGADPRRLRAASVITRAILEVIEGQCLDLELQGRPQTAPATYLRMAAAKTGALIGASLEAGAVMGGARTPLAARLRRAGRLLGTAFQVRDDWLGCWGDPGRTGKSADSDLARRKTTYPVVAAYAAAGPAQRRRLRSLFKETGPGSVPVIRALLQDLGGPLLTEDVPERLAARARAVLEGALPSGRLAEYDEVAGFLVRRAR
ncbi:MAG: polyprenyl synthetase family protein [Candidatus Dormibacterales bacterium]